MIQVTSDLHQFSTHAAPINLTFHQYLLHAAEPLLVHTGNVAQVAALLPSLEASLGGEALKYVFVSHFEADECGGLMELLKHFPEAQVICSGTTARQLSGFGLNCNTVVKAPGESLVADGFELEFFSYPSEIHLWEGLLALEKSREIFFSSDLMIRFGEAAGTVLESSWQTEVEAIGQAQVPDPEKRAKLQRTLASLSPKFVAPGHGPCLSV